MAKKEPESVVTKIFKDMKTKMQKVAQNTVVDESGKVPGELYQQQVLEFFDRNTANGATKGLFGR